MPIQKSIFKVKGKMEGQSFFYSKNGGYQLRSINPNMSETVKTDPRFTLTRKYASAFGFGAQMAAAILKTIPMRWRFLYRGNMLARLTRSYNYYFKAQMGLWGQTAQPWSSFKTSIMRDFNNQNKVAPPAWVTYFCDNFITENTGQVQLTIQRAWTVQESQVEDWKLQGASGFDVSLYTLRVARLDLDPMGQHKYVMGAAMSSLTIAHGDVDFSATAPYTIMQAQTPALDNILSPDAETIGGILVFVAPYKTVNGQKQTLQRLCTSYWFAPQTEK